MKDIIIDTLIDGAKLLPFLFITFLLMELIEHKFGDKLNKKLTKVNKIGPLLGSLLGIIPQCGISASASNFYITRVISLGTLISVYLVRRQPPGCKAISMRKTPKWVTTRRTTRRGSSHGTRSIGRCSVWNTTPLRRALRRTITNTSARSIRISTRKIPRSTRLNNSTSSREWISPRLPRTTRR